ncbi:MAG: DNA polymerase III subunit delta' [Candidatus Aureabacteria bacterium]|nr:DNA polymerase III subunit delta' [Candidatus Auribacterota bacterium]
MVTQVSYNTIYGQEKAIEILKKSINSKRIPHAMLFVGPTGTQKTETAFAFLKHLKCSNPTPMGPCNSCRNCYLFDNAMHPDVKILEPKKKARMIPIADVKALIWFVQLKAYIGKYKIGLIKSADRLISGNNAAANAILKILEDPPKNTIFILITSHKNALLPTILSRCQEIDFHPVKKETVLKYVKDKSLDHLGPEEFLVMISGGRVGRLTEETIEIVQNDRAMVQRALEAAIKRDIIQSLKISEETVSMLQDFSKSLKEKIKEQNMQESQESDVDKDEVENEMKAYIEGKVRERLDNYFNVFLLFFRDIFMCSALPGRSRFRNSDMSDFINHMTKFWNQDDIDRRISHLEQTRRRIMAYTNQKLTLDSFYLGLISC